MKKPLKASDRRTNLGASSQPPKRVASLTFDHTFRFVGNHGVSQQPVLRSDILNLVFTNISGSTTNFRMQQANRVKRVQIWDASNGTGALGFTAGLVWAGTQSQHRVYDDSSVGTAAAAYIDTRPPKQSTASFVSMAGVSESEVLFYLTCGTGAIIDLTCEVTVASDFGTATTITTTNSGIAGRAYFTYLDLSGNKYLQCPTQIDTLT